MINLYVSYYPEPDPIRNAELETCLAINLANKNIDRIFLLDETQSFQQSGKLQVLNMPHRPTFNDIFRYVNHFTKEDDINIIANSDIYFDEFPKLPGDSECFALTRYDIKDGEPVFFDRWDSQDSWWFKGAMKNINAPFNLGHPGCDNSLAYLLKQAGYNVTNPSRTVKTYHLHSNDTRNWWGKSVIPEPYFLITPND